MKTMVGGALTAVGAMSLSFSKSCIESAKGAQTAWIAFNQSVKNGSNGAKVSLDGMKSKLVELANTSGRSTGDMRQAFIDLNTQLKNNNLAMQGTTSAAALAAGKNINLSAANSLLSGGLKGNARAFKTLGLNAEEYSDIATNTATKQKFIQEVFNSNKEAYEQYANSAAGVSQRLENSFNSLKTSIGQALLPAIEPLVSLLSQIVGAFNQLPGPIKTVIAGFLLLAGGASLIAGPIMALSGMLELIGISGFFGETGLLATAQGLLAVDVAGAPLWAVVAVIAAIGFAIYEVGKYFGWWKDLPGMFDAIKAGVMRLWEAFINNEHVQDAINAITSAFQWLYQQLEPVGQWLMNLLGISEQTGDSFDIVGAIIQAVGNAFDFLWNALTPVYEGLVSLWQTVSDGVTWFTNLLGITNQLPDGFNGVVAAIIMIIGGLPVLFWTILVKVGQYIIKGMTAWVKNGINKAKSFVNGIINFVKSLPGRIWSYLISVASKIISAGASWGSNALSSGKKILNGVINGIGNIADAVFDKFNGIAGAINRAATGAINAAKDFGSRALAAFKNAINSHSPSDFYKIPANDFANIAGAINDARPSAVKAVTRFGKDIMGAYDVGFGLDLESQNLNKETTITFDHSLGVTLDLANIPGGMSESDLANMINSDKFVTAIAENSKFQQVDTNMKNRQNRRIKRANGVL